MRFAVVSEEAKKLMEDGLALLKEGANVDAVFHFERLIQEHGKHASVLSSLGLATARAGGNMKDAEKYCIEALRRQKFVTIYYQNLADVYVIGGKKAHAVKVLRRALLVDRDNREILNQLRELGIRKKVPVSFLSRSNPINRYLGLFRTGRASGRRRK
jgi:Flp pilus assembly protein TadD